MKIYCLKYIVLLLARLRRVSHQFSPADRKRHRIRTCLKAKLFEDIWHRSVRQLGASARELHGGFARINLGDRVTYVHESSVCLDSHLVLRMAGNKVLVYKMLEESGHILPPKYRSFSVRDIEPALLFFRNVCQRVVVKPAAGTGGGAGVTSNISTQNVLIKAIIQAGSLRNDLLVEEQIPGISYRLLYLGGELIDVIERKPPTVTGNGTDSIFELVKMENELRVNARGLRGTSLIDVDLEMNNCLRTQGITLRDTPALNQSVRLKNVVNQNNATENKRVFDSIHPTFRKLGRKVAEML